MTAPDATTDPGLKDVAWDLSHLLDGSGEDPQAAVDGMLEEAQRRADAFAAEHAGKVAEPVSLEVALARLFLPDRGARRHAAEQVTAALEPGLRARGYAFNTLLADKMVDDRLRSYPHWL